MIRDDLKEYVKLLDSKDISNPEISKWSIHSHVEHILVSNLKITELILNSEQNKNFKKLNLLGRIVLFIGKIPRGKGKAPEFSKPKGLETEELRKIYNLFLENLQKIESLKSTKILAEHPLFGALNVKQWLRFIDIHQKHHLKIIREIIQKQI